MIVNKKINYLNNKDMLKEIHKSKISYCQYEDSKYTDYDIILPNKTACFSNEIVHLDEKGRIATKEEDIVSSCTLKEYTINTAKNNRSSRLATEKIKAEKSINPGVKINKKALVAEIFSELKNTDIVFRITTYEHIPLQEGRKKNPKNIADLYVKLNFSPFKHYIYNEDESELIEVLKSHSKDGEFCKTHGSITDNLCKMFLLLTHRYSQRGNWRGYTYVDEMKGQAMLHLAVMCLHFDEAESDNPFAYYTTFVKNSFTRVFNSEKRMQELRDNLLSSSGHNPSYTRQLDHEFGSSQDREGARIWGGEDYSND